MSPSSLRHSLRALAAGALVALPLVAEATALAELRWGGRFGGGYIVYDRDAVDAVDADGRGSFLGAIREFDFYGIRLPYGTASISLRGTGGSILSLDKPEPCGFGKTCDWSSVSFLVGAAHEGDPLSYKMTMRLPFLLDDLDLIPLGEGPDGLLPGGIPDETNPPRVIGGWISNEFNSPAGNYLTMGWGAVYNRLLPAPPVPEPATLAMFGVGAAMLVWGRRRMRS